MWEQVVKPYAKQSLACDSQLLSETACLLEQIPLNTEIKILAIAKPCLPQYNSLMYFACHQIRLDRCMPSGEHGNNVVLFIVGQVQVANESFCHGKIASAAINTDPGVSST